MVGLDTLVYVIVFLLIAALIIGLLYWLITYIEGQGIGPPILFKIIKIVLVVLVVLFCIGCLLHLLGFPIIRMPAQGVAR